MTTALYRLRLSRGQSLRQLANDVGVSYETIRRIEHGQGGVSPSTRLALERTFRLPYEVIAAPLNDHSGGAHQDTAAVDSHSDYREVDTGDLL